jgi:hypothetical protein
MYITHTPAFVEERTMATRWTWQNGWAAAWRLGLVAVLVLSWTTYLQASPVTFQFEAIIGPLPPGNTDVGLPFVLQQGSVLQGRVTLDQDIAGVPLGTVSKSVQPFDFMLTFDAHTFGTGVYLASVFDDNQLIDGPNPGPADIIRLDCPTEETSCQTSSLFGSESQTLLLSMRLAMFGRWQFSANPAYWPLNMEVPLSEPVLPSDADTWNEFNLERSLWFTFSDTQGHVACYPASIGPFTVVPEPSVFTVLLSAVSIAVFGCQRF